MKKLLSAVTTAAMVASVVGGSVAHAAPEPMADGSLFDAEYYAAQNPDVVAVFGTDANALYQHYAAYGMKEGRVPFAMDGSAVALPDGSVFDPAYYAASNPDVVAALGSGADAMLAHYQACGKAEGRKPAANASAAVVIQEPTAPVAVETPVVVETPAVPVDPATLPYYATFTGLIVTAENQGYSELANAGIALLSAPEATLSVVRMETPGYELISSDKSLWVQAAVVEQDTTPVDQYVPGDFSIFTFHVRGDYQGQHYDRYIAYGPEMKRYEDAEKQAASYLIGQMPQFNAFVQYAGYRNQNLVQVYADHLGIQIVLAENDISNLKDYDDVVVNVSRVATDADKAGKSLTPWIVGTVTKAE